MSSMLLTIDKSSENIFKSSQINKIIPNSIQKLCKEIVLPPCANWNTEPKPKLLNASLKYK